MPEGPEVRIMSDRANLLMSGGQLTAVKIISGKHLGLADNWRGLKLPCDILGVKCHGKLCWIDLGSRGVIRISFGMSGAFREVSASHCHIEFAYQNKLGEAAKLWFYDPRSFGNVAWISDGISGEISKLGVDLLTFSNAAEATAHMRKRGGKRNICVALMDQSIWAGVGNYIKSESLYRSSISPWSNVNGLSDEQLLRLWTEAQNVAILSYNSRGASIYTYRDSEGETGTFQDLLMVYGKKTDPWGRKITSAETPDKRTTWYVDVSNCGDIA